MACKSIVIHVDADEIDTAIEKANRLAELLKEACHMVDSLSGKSNQSEP